MNHLHNQMSWPRVYALSLRQPDHRGLTDAVVAKTLKNDTAQMRMTHYGNTTPTKYKG